MKNLEHIMLDLETMGNKSNSAIVSIAAVEFDIKSGEIGDQFYKRIDLDSCLKRGLKVNADTIYWWLQQNKDARLELTQKGEELSYVLQLFSKWLNKQNKSHYIWGNGARFDIGLLEDAYVACDYDKMPWNFRKELDLRTLVFFAPEIKKQVFEEWKNKSIAHNPIDDCKKQIEYARRIWNKINVTNQ